MAVRARTSLTLGRPPHEDEHHATESTEAGDCQERLVDGWFKGIVADGDSASLTARIAVGPHQGQGWHIDGGKLVGSVGAEYGSGGT